MTHRCTAGAIALALIAFSSAGAAGRDDALQMNVTPSYAYAPAHVRIQARVAPADDNRALEVIADSGSFYRSTTIELEGAAAPRAHLVEFRGVPAGTYEVQVVLRGGNGRARATLYHRVVVIGHAGE
jgi:hypothetical protein